MKLMIFITGLLLITAHNLFAQQDIEFSQYVFNGLSVNPGYAGYKEDLYFNSVYRQQWVNFPGAPQTGAVSLDGLLNGESKSVGLGGQLSWDKLGPQQTTSFFGSYAYRIRINSEDSKRLCIGIGIGGTQYSLDGTALQYVDANDPSIPVGKISTIKPDARAGVYYYTENYYAGVALMDLFSLTGDRKIFLSNGSLYATETKDAHMYLTFGGLIKMSDNVKLKPSLLMKEDFHGPTSVDLNLFALLSEKLWVGASYRTAAVIWQKKAVDDNLSRNGAISIMAELFVNNRLRVGYSYDFVTSGLAGYQDGSHEISVSLLFPNRKDEGRIKSPRYF